MNSRKRISQFFCVTVSALTLLTAGMHASAQSPGAADGTQQFGDLGSCPLENGQTVLGCKLGYRTWGKLNAAQTNAILVPMWFTGTSAQLAGSVGAGKLLDPERYYIVGIDPLANGVSTSPSNSAEQPRMSFPAITIHDMVESEYLLATRVLHLTHVHAVMGTSMGGMQTFAWAAQHPDFMDCAVPIVGSPRMTSYDLLLWRGEEDGVRADPAWQMGNYTTNPPLPQVAILHGMNLVTPGYYARTVSRDHFPATYADYGMHGVDAFDANNRIYQLEAMIHQDIAHGGDLTEAESRIHTHMLVVASEQDHMVNPGPALAYAEHFHVKTLLLHSDCGHLAPNCEADTVAKAVNEFLAAN